MQRWRLLVLTLIVIMTGPGARAGNTSHSCVKEILQTLYEFTDVNRTKAQMLIDRRTARLIHEAVHQNHMPAVKLQPSPEHQRTVVLIHGLSRSPRAMAKISDAYFRDGFNVVEVLLDGHGRSSFNLDLLLTFPEQALHVWNKDINEAVLIAKSLSEDVTLNGFSMGGALALKYAQENTTRINRLVLNAPDIGVNPRMQRATITRAENHDLWLTQNTQEILQGKIGLEDFPFIWTTDNPDVVIGRHGFRKRAEQFNAFGYQRTPSKSVYVLKELSQYLEKLIREEKVPVPTNVIWSDADILIAPEILHELSKKPNVTSKFYPKTEKITHFDTESGEKASDAIAFQIQWIKSFENTRK